MIKAFLFDWGGVMTTGGRGGELDARLATNLAVTPQVAWDLLEPVWPAYSRGEITEMQLWEQIEAKYGKLIEPAQRKI